MSALAKKLAEAKRKRLEKLQSTSNNVNTNPTASASAGLLAQTKQATAKNEPSATTALDKLSLRISEQNSELQAHIEEQEAKGVYSFDEKIKDIKGLDPEDFITRMKALDAATLEKTPDIRTFSAQISKNLRQYPELTHILTDYQLSILVKGVLFISDVETAPKTKQAKAAADKKRLTELSTKSLDELGF